MALLHNNVKNLQEMIDIMFEISQKYRIKFGLAKSKHLIIGGTKGMTEKDKTLKLGNDILEQVDFYKYLGMHVNQGYNLKTHIPKLEEKVMGAIYSILNTTNDLALQRIEMRTIWIMLENTINAILTYGLEAYKMDKTDYDELNRIQLKGIRVLLNLPDNVANEIILSETGIKQIDLEIKKNRIIYEKDLRERFGNESQDSEILETAHNIYKKWKDQIKNDKVELGLVESDMNQTKECLKRCIKEKLNIIMKDRIVAATAKKSTVKAYIEKMLNSKEEIACRKEYIDDLSRAQVKNIIIARASRLQTKNNHAYKHDNLKCRW